jgi:hydrophobic/amphiphilic exporter-1 (mainly G- bacteria), HAE1 family
VSVSDPFIRRPVATTLVMLALIVFGLMGYRLLPVSDLPNVDFPTILVTANLPGASPDTMAAAVATPLEKQFSTIAGIDAMSSASSIGVTQVTIQFDLSRSLDAAAQDVQAAIGAAARQLPPDLPNPPVYQKVNPADQPIVYVALTSPSLPLYELDRYGETLLAQRISMVPGVAQVQVFGSQKFAVRVQVSADALASRGIGLDEVQQAVQAANTNQPTGTLEGAREAFTLDVHGELTKAAQYRPIVVAYRNGAPVRLDELGRVVDSVENDKAAAWFGDQRAVVLAVQRQPGTNTVAVSDAVQRLLPTFRAQIPGSVTLHVLYDRAAAIRASADDVRFTLALTLALVVLVIFLFLRSLRATLIPSLALPLSIVGTFAAMYLLGYSLDNLSLMALTLSVGFVVDDAIVVLENIVRHVEAGAPPFEAALEGAREIGFTVVSMTISLSAVFIPVLFMGGILGRLFHEFAVTIGVAILVSGFVALTLTPMISARLLRGGPERHGRLYLASERAFDAALARYERGLRWSLRHRRLVLLGSAVVLVLTALLFVRIPKGFLPSEDTGAIFVATEGAQGISFEDMVRKQQAAAAIVARDPNVDAFMSSCGQRGASGFNNGVIFMHLKPRAERALSADQVIAELRPKLAQLPGLRSYVQNPPPIRLGGRLTSAQYQYTLQSGDTARLYPAAGQLERRMRALPLLQDVNSDLKVQNPQVEVDIDRDRAATLGISAASIELALSNAFASRQISTIYAPDDTYQVILELLPDEQRDPAALSRLYVRASSGRLVPLEAVARLGLGVGPLVLNHSGQLPSVTISFNLRPGASLGTAVAAVDRLARDAVPAGITTSFQGTAQAFQSSLQGLGVLLALAILVIYLVLGVLYESFIHPLTILTALPFAGFGALVTLLAFGADLSVYAFVGIVMLVGLVKKNGIMMVDFALEAERGGQGPEEAIYEACKVRFRPIMMTTVAALMGTLPIALGAGAGAESRRPLGLAVVGGLLFSQSLTLFVTPVFFVYMDRLQRWLRRTATPSAHSVRPSPTRARTEGGAGVST